MKLYEVQLPAADNTGNSYTEARDAWENHALEVCGGFSRCSPMHGAWRDSGVVYVEEMVPYRIACDTGEQFAKLLAVAFELFPDQLAIFHAEIGTATIATRVDGNSRKTLPGPSVDIGTTAALSSIPHLEAKRHESRNFDNR